MAARRRWALAGGVALVVIVTMALLAGMALAAATAGTPGAGITGTLNESASTTDVSGFVWPAGMAGLSYSVYYAPEGSDFCQSDGTTTDAYQSTAPTPMPAKDTDFTVQLTQLTPASQYCLDVVALKSSEIVTSSASSAAAIGAPLPSFTAGTPNLTVGTEATIAGPTSDRLSATANPAGSAVTYEFEWAPRFSSWCQTLGASGTPTVMPSTALAAGHAYVNLSGILTGLTPGQYYCAGVSAENATGTTTVISFGETESGFMAGVPRVVTGAATNVSAVSARLGYRVDSDLDPAAEVYLEWRPTRGGRCTRASLAASPAAYQYADTSLRVSAAMQSGALPTNRFAATDPLARLMPRTQYCYMAELASDEPNPFQQNVYYGRIRYFTTR